MSLPPFFRMLPHGAAAASLAMVWFYIMGGLTLVSLALHGWQWLAARRFPVHQAIPQTGALPSVTLLKPLKGCDEHTKECLQSWLTQDYPAPVQVLFGVYDLADPVCDVVRQLIREHPGRDLQLIHCPATLGPNPKVSTLMQLEPGIACTAGQVFASDGSNNRTGDPPDPGIAGAVAPFHAVVVSDADVRVPPGYLREAMGLLLQNCVGLVNSFYRLPAPQNRAMWIEAIAVNCDFWSQVCQSNSLRPMRFALGAVMGLRYETLTAVGGFQALVDYLADDNRLGQLVFQSGKRIELTHAVVDCHSGPMRFRQVWEHQLRWARTIRVCEPLPFFFSILTNTLVWSVLWLLTAIPAGLHWPLFTAGGGLLLYVLVRLATAHANGNRLYPGGMPLWKIAQVLDVRDMLGALWWLFAFLGNTIVWRGRRHRILKEGRLRPLS